MICSSTLSPVDAARVKGTVLFAVPNRHKQIEFAPPTWSLLPANWGIALLAALPVKRSALPVARWRRRLALPSSVRCVCCFRQVTPSRPALLDGSCQNSRSVQ